MTFFIPMLSRALFFNRVRTTVFHTFRTHPSMLVLRTTYPATQDQLRPSWQQHTNAVQVQLAGLVYARFFQLLTDLLNSFAGQQTPTQQAGNGGPARDPMKLTVDELVQMLDNPGLYVVHRTDDEAVGTCQADVVAETDRSKMKNTLTTIGIYLSPGISGLPSFGDYGVVFLRSVLPLVSKHGTEDILILPGNNARLGVDKAIGWYHKSTLAEAVSKRSS